MDEHTNATSTPENATGLGVTHCTCCGGAIEAVGPLRPEDAKYRGHCDYCARQAEVGDTLVDEAKALLRPWYLARRHVKDDDLSEVVQVALGSLDDEYKRHREGN